ncbi:hypothetical protein O0I10_008264 [Lichtheimia ornata]|uniref:F-box domain-containing protein n=1 Tax=Lichtheimia ornata TaxID=688661 RepID=A0AAD7V0R8_9FUNG|nr:uncharacterized protein O0I10_008264 [Lichtheimia ornata]KAJ8656042.1 hypothetical protein O0I10_008264 [Lichtheimia ornata]
MSLTAASLPREILTLISHHVTSEDYFACLYVCHNWSIAFTSILYATVSITNSCQCSLFYDTLLESARRSRKGLPQRTNLGHCVKILRIKASRPRAEMVRRLPGLCPNLQVFDISNDPGFTSIDNDTCPTATSYRVADLKRLPSNAGYAALSLTQLSITSEYGIVNLDWLNGLHTLKKLQLNWSKQIWTFERMDEVHDWCPHLERLELVLDRSDFNKTDLVGLQLPPESMPAPSMQHISLTLPYHFAEYQAAAWLIYFASKYPNLRALCLDTNPTHHYSMAFALEYMDAPILNSSVETARLRSYRLFAQGCRQLDTVHLKDIGLYRHFFHALWDTGHIKLQHLEIDETRNFPSGTIAQCFDWWKGSLHSLGLKGATYMPMNINLPWSLRLLTYLSHLEIVRPYGKLPIGLLLDCASSLKSLELYGTELCTTMQLYTNTHRRFYSSDLSSHSLPHHPLQRLVIRGHNRLSEKVITYIGRRCLSLQHFELDDCTLSDIEEDNKGAIQLPYQSLEIMSLNNVCLLRSSNTYRRSGSQIEVFAVHTATNAGRISGTRCDHYRWYDMKEPRQQERVLGRMPSKRRGAVLRLKNHLLIQCQSIDRLYVGQHRLLL